MINIDKDLYKGFPNILSCLPEGTRLIPYEGEWLIMPPESSMLSEVDFNAWKDKIYNSAIDLGLNKKST